MTLVLQTTVDTKPETDDAIREVLSRFGVHEQDPSVTFGVDTFSYYRVPGGQDTTALIRELLKLPGVAAAYIKPWGAPPM